MLGEHLRRPSRKELGSRFGGERDLPQGTTPEDQRRETNEELGRTLHRTFSEGTGSSPRKGREVCPETFAMAKGPKANDVGYNMSFDRVCVMF